MAFPDLIILKHLNSVKLTIILLVLIVIASTNGLSNTVEAELLKKAPDEATNQVLGKFSLDVVGLFLSFYMSYKRIWVKLSVSKGGTVVEIV